MVRTTLDVILARLPKLLKDRYGGNVNAFWVNKYNDLLTELEETRCGPNNTVMFPIPWQMVQQGEVIKPRHLTGITNLYFSTGGEVSWETDGNNAHIIEETPTESTIMSMNNFVASRQRAGRDILHLNNSGTTEPGDAIIIHSAIGNSQPGVYNPNDFPKAGWVISYTPPTEYMGASGYPIGIPMEAGEYDFPINAGTDFYWTFRDFLIVEGHRAFHRIAASAEITSLPPEWDDLVEAYLRFRGEVQTDQFSKNASDWGSIWQTMKRRWCISHSRKPSSAKTKRLRPSLVFNGPR